jgi:AraC-like DNA-binding protein
MRIQEIAEKTGFNDPTYFARSFKKLAGVTPKEYQTSF